MENKINQRIQHYAPLSKKNEKIINEFIENKKIEKGMLSPNTLKNSEETLKKLAHQVNNKNLKELTEQDLKNFFKSIETKSYQSRDAYATNIIQFYRWTNKLDKNTRPINMKWFEYTTNKIKRKLHDINTKEKYFITPDEYKKMLTWGNDQYGQSKALWETLFISGVRPNELLSMKIKDVTTDKEGHTTITITESKTFERTIPMLEPPRNLLQYIENHPHKNNKEAWLWFPFKNTIENKPLQYNNLKNQRFNKMIKDLKLKSTLTLKSFRKTRATIIFESNKLQFKEIGKIMGWTTETVAKRQEEYLLTNNEDIIKKYCTEAYTEPTQQQLKKEQSETISTLKNEITKLNKKIEDINNILGTKLKQILEKTKKENPSLSEKDIHQKAYEIWISHYKI